MRVTIVRGRATGPSVNKVAKTLADNGYHVKLLLWDRQHTLDTKSGEGYTVHTFRLRAPYNRAIVLFYLPIWWMYEFWFLLRHRCDFIHACDLDTLMPAILAKLVKRVRLCYTIYDFYARNLTDGRFLPVREAIRVVVSAVERFGIRFTDALFLVSESQYQDVREARINKLTYIYNSPRDYLGASGQHQSRQASEMTIFYAGSLHRSRGVESMIEAVAGLEGVRLIIGGLLPEGHMLSNQIERASDRVRYLGWLPYEKVIDHTLAADILFAFYDPSVPQNRLSSPNKLFEAMMAGKPIIVSDGTWGANTVKEENCGLVVPYGDVQAIEAALLRLKNDPHLRQKLGANGRRAYQQKYSWRIMEQGLLDIYRQLGKHEAARRGH